MIDQEKTLQLPPYVVFEETAENLDEALYEEEEIYIRTVSYEREVEFRSVRACARRALNRLGVQREPMAPSKYPTSPPVWPSGVIGALTHCDGYRAAAVTNNVRCTGLGIDAEVNQPLPHGTAARIASPRERASVQALYVRVPSVCWDRLMFSAKEAAYKALIKSAPNNLHLSDIRVELFVDGRFRVLLRSSARDAAIAEACRSVSGYWVKKNSVLKTGVLLEAPIARDARFFAEVG